MVLWRVEHPRQGERLLRGRPVLLHVFFQWRIPTPRTRKDLDRERETEVLQSSKRKPSRRQLDEREGKECCYSMR